MMPSDLRDLIYAFAQGISDGAPRTLMIGLAIIGVLIYILELDITVILAELVGKISTGFKPFIAPFVHLLRALAKKFHWGIDAQNEAGTWLGIAWISHYGLTLATAFTGIYFLILGALMLMYLPMWSWLALVYATVATACLVIGGMFLGYSPRVALLMRKQN